MTHSGLTIDMQMLNRCSKSIRYQCQKIKKHKNNTQMHGSWNVSCAQHSGHCCIIRMKQSVIAANLKQQHHSTSETAQIYDRESGLIALHLQFLPHTSQIFLFQRHEKHFPITGTAITNILPKDMCTNPFT